MNRALSICKKTGCNKLLQSPGYCENHQPVKVNRFENLDKKKTPEQRKFYSSARWTEVSKRHRQNEPLCRRCKKNGRVVKGDLVHHNPPLEELLSQGRSPYDDSVLETLCTSCHQKELYLKRDYVHS